jgi:hypothetical protein
MNIEENVMVQKEEEIWKEIPGYPKYQVSNLGRVRTPRHFKAPKILKFAVGNSGYAHLQLTFAKYCSTTMDIHRLVAITFLGVPFNDTYQVNHKDGNKLNNRLENLVWVSPQENIHHAIQNGHINQFGENGPNTKLSAEQVLAIRKEMEDSKWKLTYKALGEKYGVNSNTIRLIVYRLRWRCI